MRKILFLVPVLSLVCCGSIIEGPAFAQTEIGLKEVLPEGVKLGMSYRHAKRVLGEPLEKSVRNDFYGVGKALFRTDEDSYIVLHFRMGNVKHIDIFEDLSYDAVIKRFNELR